MKSCLRFVLCVMLFSSILFSFNSFGENESASTGGFLRAKLSSSGLLKYYTYISENGAQFVSVNDNSMVIDDQDNAYMVYATQAASAFTTNNAFSARPFTEEPERKIPLNPGWNLIDFSVNKCFYEGTEPLNKPNCVVGVDVINELKFNSFREWFNSIFIPEDGWQMVISSEGDAMNNSLSNSSLKYMSPDLGYWVKVKEGVGPAFLLLDNPPFDQNCPIILKKGWNLVGCYTKFAYYDAALSSPVDVHVPEGTEWITVFPPVADFLLRSIKDKYEMIIGENGAYNPGLPGLNSLHFMAPGYSYWIKMKETSEFIYQED